MGPRFQEVRDWPFRRRSRVKNHGPRIYGEEFRKAYAEGRYSLAVESYGEHAAYNRRAEEIVAPALAADTASLAQAVKADLWRMVVYNPLPWQRGGVVEAPARPERRHCHPR